MLLAKSGCSRFALVDPEDLKEDNVVRHLCGLNVLMETKKKVEAVRGALEEHLGYVSCDTQDKDVLEVLSTNPQAFDKAKLVILAIANMGAERRVNDLFRTERPRSIVYVWIEPLGVAGHVLYISPEEGGCYRCCFDQNGDFRFAVATKDNKLDRREAGCQQTFTPYGAADLELFCSVACKEILRLMEHAPETSRLSTWIGDKEQFVAAGHKINDSYAAHESFGIYRREIASHPSCPTCNQ